MKPIKFLTSFLIIGFLLSGCSIEYGQQVTSSHYVYPNSNVTPLGYTTAELSKFGILFPSQIKKNDYERLFNEALAKHQGADIIIDMGIDVKYTRYPIPILTLWTTKFTLQGTAASMEVGEQELSHGSEQLINESEESDIKKTIQPNVQSKIESEPEERTSVTSEKSQSSLRFGIKTGVNMVNYQEDFFNSKAGFLFGGFLNYKLSNVPLSIQPELLYNQRKAFYDFDGFETDFNVDLLEVPVLAKLELGNRGQIQPHILVGPHGTFDISNSTDINNSGLDLGGTVGVGTEFNLGESGLALDARYRFMEGVGEFAIAGGIIF